MTRPSDQQLINLAAEHAVAGRLGEAESIYRDLLARHPGNAELPHMLGILAFQGGRYEEARAAMEAAIALDSSQANYFNNLGLVLHAQDEFEPALAQFEHALRLDPALAIVFYNAGNTRAKQGRLEAAAGCFRRALERMPDHGFSYLNLGLVLARQGDHEGEISTYRTALARLPAFAPLWNNLGNALKRTGDWDAAADAYREAVRVDPGDALAMNNLGDCLKEVGRLAEAIDHFRRSVELRPSLASAHSNLIFSMHFHRPCPPSEIAAESARWWAQHGAPLRPARSSFENERVADRRLRIGYVSPDFRDHPVGRQMLAILQHHDRTRFEVRCYSDANPADDTTARCRAAAGAGWRETSAWADDRCASAIREDQIDILIDLALHSAGNRLCVFAREPAPVQVSFAGYPGATGVETIAWHLTDRCLEPPAGPAAEPPSRPIYLPDSFWLYQAEDSIDAASPQARDSTRFVFGCLSRFAKLSEDVFSLWAQILRAVPHASLLTLCPALSARRAVREFFHREGVDPERIEFTGTVSRRDYLALYRGIDVVLDPFPYNGHMTTCDALWMGVPVVSLVGETPVARGGLSILSNLGLSELAATTPLAYVELATALATRPELLARFRENLGSRMRASVLMDAARYTKGLEAAFQEMWEQWCQAKKSCAV